MDEHMAWVAAQVAAGGGGGGSAQERVYWAAVGGILAQLRGVSAGYSAAVTDPAERMTVRARPGRLSALSVFL
jgi:hypothetical protein